MTERGLTVEVSAKGRRRVKELAERLGMNATSVVECAVQVLHAVHFVAEGQGGAVEVKLGRRGIESIGVVMERMRGGAGVKR